MNVFVSHAIQDRKLISQLNSRLNPLGVRLLIAEHCSDIQFQTITEKVKALIKHCDVALVCLTKNGFNSAFVQQEIGYLVNSNKPYLQIVEKGLEKKITGFNYGKGYVLLDQTNPLAAISKVANLLTPIRKKMMQDKISSELLASGMFFAVCLLIYDNLRQR